MSEMNIKFCCGTDEDLCKDVTCKIDETENGFTFTVTSDNPERVEKLKSMMKSCCSDDKDGKSSCC